MNHIIHLILTVSLVLFSFTNARSQPKSDPYVLLISLDGFRYDYAEKYGATTLLEMAKEGATAEFMRPSYPSKTFPNQYTLVTGLYPDNHGIVANEFYDPKRQQDYSIRNPGAVTDGSWYGGTPIWVLAEQQGLKTASYFWLGSEAEIDGGRPTYYEKFNNRVPHQERIDQVVEWFKLPEEERPRLVTLYFSITDQAGHRFGPEAEQTKGAVEWLNGDLENLMEEIRNIDLDINVVVVSDHGMLAIDKEIFVKFPVDREEFRVISARSFAYVYHEDAGKIDQLYLELKEAEGPQSHFSVYKRGELPDYLHFGKNERAGDLIVIAEPPYIIRPDRRLNTGEHGFDPYNTPEMGAIFYAWGPQIQPGTRVEPFQNIHVYPLIAELLGLSYEQESIDGNIEVLEGILRK